MNKEKNKNLEREHCCDCGNTRELICISLPYIETPKFRCQNCSIKLYKKIIQNK